MIEPIMEKAQFWELQSRIYKINNKGLLYHDLPCDLKKHGINVSYIRNDCQERVDLISSHYDFKNKRGLDLGCYAGGITFRIGELGAKITGIESGKDAVDLAILLAFIYESSAKFIFLAIGGFLDSVLCFEEHNTIDFCIYFGTFMWIVYHEGLMSAKMGINLISIMCPTMFFESSVGDGIAGPVMMRANLDTTEKLIDFILKNSQFTAVKNLGKIAWGNRDILMFTR